MPLDSLKAAKPRNSLFDSVDFGAVHARNRIVMAPMTRLRAAEEGIPGDLVVDYYRQRASTGMIITEGTWPVREGRTWIGQPGIETSAQQAGWARVADAVHAEGGKIAMQIMHGGRVSHPALTGTGRIVAPSATAAPNPIRVPGGKAAPPVAHALTTEEVRQVIGQFVDAARRAMDAGMDAVELHGANGYLIHEFFSPASNLRTDDYGGTPVKRARFAVEVTEAVADAVGPDRTGIRISPEHAIQGMSETDPAATWQTYSAYAEAVSGLGLAFLDVLHHAPGSDFVQHLRRTVGSPMISNTGFGPITSRQEAEQVVAEGYADAAAVGRPLIANPDLVERWERRTVENVADTSTDYLGGARGYTDYPTLAEQLLRT